MRSNDNTEREREREMMMRITNDKPITSHEGGVAFCRTLGAVSVGGKKFTISSWSLGWTFILYTQVFTSLYV